jgi:hypothetical protein
VVPSHQGHQQGLAGRLHLYLARVVQQVLVAQTYPEHRPVLGFLVVLADQWVRVLLAGLVFPVVQEYLLRRRLQLTIQSPLTRFHWLESYIR